MKKLKIVITDEQGTVLGTTTVELNMVTIDQVYLLHREMIRAIDGINWNRISNLLGSE